MKNFKLILSVLIVFVLMTVSANAQNLDIKIGKSYSNGESIELKSKSNFNIVIDNTVSIKTNTKNLKINFDGKDIKVLNNNKVLVDSFQTNGVMLISSDQPISVNGMRYRGSISFRINNSKLDVINNVEMEDYLKGVVPKELSASYPLEALKAQAIVSRSFAMANINKYKKLGYNLNDTTSSQVYRGLDAEEKRSNEAVDSTKGLMVYYEDEIANTIFGASSGGIVADASEVWGGKSIPYLTSFMDNYSTYSWDLSLKNSELQKIFGKYIYSLDILEKDSSGRVSKVLLNGTDELKTSSFRSKIGNAKFKSTLFDIEKTSDGFKFTGRGYGHGVGFSQYGAVEMAKQGFKTEDILKYYFKGTDIRWV